MVDLWAKPGFFRSQDAEKIDLQGLKEPLFRIFWVVSSIFLGGGGAKKKHTKSPTSQTKKEATIKTPIISTGSHLFGL